MQLHGIAIVLDYLLDMVSIGPWGFTFLDIEKSGRLLRLGSVSNLPDSEDCMASSRKHHTNLSSMTFG